MVEQFVNEYLTKLNGRIPDEYLNIVQAVLQRTLNKYEVKLKEVALVPYTGVLPESVKAFIVTKKIEGKSPKTLDLYLMYLKDFFATTRMQPREITPNIVRAYLFEVQDTRKISNRSLDSRRSTLSSFFSWAAAEGYVDKNPMTTVRPIVYERTERKPLTDTELEKVREACKDIREKAMVEFLFSTGCRVTEMERVNRADVDFLTMEVKLFGKGNKHRKSYLTAKAALLLRQYLDTRTDDKEPLFVNVRSPHDRMGKSGIEEIIRQIGKRAGVPRLHPHLLRHTTATMALQHGMDVTQVQQLLGHSSLDTTMIYAKIDGTDLQRNHRRCLA